MSRMALALLLSSAARSGAESASCAGGTSVVNKVMHYSSAGCRGADLTRVDKAVTDLCYYDTDKNMKLTLDGANLIANAYDLSDSCCSGAAVAPEQRFAYMSCSDRADGTSFKIMPAGAAKLNLVEVYSDSACTDQIGTTYLAFNVCHRPPGGKFTTTICQGSAINTYHWTTDTCSGGSTTAWTFNVGDCAQFPGDDARYYKAPRCNNAFDTTRPASPLAYVEAPMLPPPSPPPESECVKSACRENGGVDADCCGAKGSTSCEDGYEHSLVKFEPAGLPEGFFDCRILDGNTCCKARPNVSACPPHVATPVLLLALPLVLVLSAVGRSQGQASGGW